MVKFLGKIYNWLLWFAGEPISPDEVSPTGEKYSHKLWRQKERLGKWWWVGLGIISFIISLFIAAYVWLVLHVLKKV